MNSLVGIDEQRVDAAEDLPTADGIILSASLDEDSEPRGTAYGVLSLYHGDRKVGEGTIRTQPGQSFIAEEALTVSRDGGEPVASDYPGESPWRFTGGEAAAMVARE